MTVVSRTRHTGDTVDTDGVVAAVASTRRQIFIVSVFGEGTLEVFLRSDLDFTAGTGILVSAAVPLHFATPYYGAIVVAAVEGNVQYTLTECFN